MNRELFMVFVPGISWILFALGGTQISAKVPGWKGWRRFILPAVYTTAVLIAGYWWWLATLVGIVAMIVYSFPYGDRTPWVIRFCVGCCYGIISAPIGLSWWNVITVVVFVGLFILSNTRVTARTFTWKVCEGFFGLLVGIQIAYKLLDTKRFW
jgi:hypothetical protein